MEGSSNGEDGGKRRGTSAAKGGGASAPVPVWKMEEAREIGSSSRPQDGHGRPDSRRRHRRRPSLPFPSAGTGGAAVSARKLGADLWEIHDFRCPRMNRRMARTPHHDEELPADLSEKDALCAADLAASMILHHKPADRNGPLSPASFDSSTHVGRRSAYGLETSMELLRVLNRIWSLEEHHASNLAMIKSLKLELELAKAQIEDLSLERNEEQEMLQGERRMRRRSESLQRKVARELSELKESFLRALEDLERERKARDLLESLCDEFAEGQKSCGGCGHGRDRPVLHIAEEWLAERLQMKLAGARGDLREKNAILERLTSEIESFVQSRWRNSSHREVLHADLSVDGFFRRQPLESAQPRGPGDDDDDGSVSGDSHCFEFSIGETGAGSLVEKKPELRRSDPPKREADPIGRFSRLSADPSGSRPQICRRSVEFPLHRRSQTAGGEDPTEVSDCSTEFPRGSLKENTLKAKLLEARMAAKYARLRTS
ncbi:unnamed protein product [Spirodela intermedia]|uniref:Uncharacterized protein n=1 Tax=Spirodela intermedia TaxID=51605 RepID=A0A7I8JS15_SPIIN|nr:unnamed protein product [Spirodela intermedia]CAA6672914.1 unnamed protein product [Spirodela intermedia]